jgi:hypothetical protein
MGKVHPYFADARRLMRKLSQQKQPLQAALQTVQRMSRREIEQTLKRSAVGQAATEIAHPWHTVLSSLRKTAVGQALFEIRDAEERGIAGELLKLASQTPAGHAAMDVARYAKGGFLTAILGELGPIGQVIDFVRGLRSNTGDATSKQVADAIDLLKAHGYEIAPPGPARGAGTGSPPPSPPRHGGFDIGAEPPESGGGLHGLVRAGTGGPGLPVGTFPGGLYVPMELVPGSSNVYAIGYTEDTLTMRVEYLAPTINAESLRGRGHRGTGRVRGRLHKTVMRARHGPGPLYDYHGVPRGVFINIRMSASKGTAIWDNLRVRGTVYGHQYDYELVAGAKSLVMENFGLPSQRRVGTVTYVPRKAVAEGMFKSRTIHQGNQVFRSILPSQGLSKRP